MTRLDDLSRAIWQGWGANAVTDDQAQELASLIHARKLVMRGEVKPVGIPRGVRPSSRLDGLSGLLCGLWPLPGDVTLPPRGRFLHPSPASSRWASWLLCGS
ncbi:hypothetical protein ACFQY9_37780 [Microvirga aerilata]|uniref:hypothetical protein n=1 Tax=Microvirga aerilata TaxID=670292 RepID=UPI00362C3475